MSAEHNHEPRCCCGPAKADPCPRCTQHGQHNHVPRCCCRGMNERDPDWESCPACPCQRELATPYTEQETTNG